MKKYSLVLLSAGILTLSIPFSASGSTAAAIPLGKQVLAPGDGWASEGRGTTGGSAASVVQTVTTRKQLVDALTAGGSTPKIIEVSGAIDFNVDDHNRPLTFEDYIEGTPYISYEKYFEDLKNASTKEKAEGDRTAAHKKQEARVQVNIPSNTTIVGKPGTNAAIIGGNLIIGKGSDNVIIRNIEFKDAYDYFPKFEANDGKNGAWNAYYDNISIRGGTHVWIDHCTFSDGDRIDLENHTIENRRLQHHDGLVDIGGGSDFITLSYNHFYNHDKTMMIDGTKPKEDKHITTPIRVTLHHNYFENFGQRAPRVNDGQVDIYNNFYKASKSSSNGYNYKHSWGYDEGALMYAENNAFEISGETKIASNQSGIRQPIVLFDKGTLLNGKRVEVDKNEDWASNVGWQPTLRLNVQPTAEVKSTVTAEAGAGKL
ncbi:pectate lyase family protein [Paenibacillus turpanensis]|uniref:pectate lyase family protein n=1 Tax=Paenibacillus turpanensis TaxID=2689078 RepID=UPI00140E6486|nr:pectate lyase [Paenibacillus turpanensis]